MTAAATGDLGVPGSGCVSGVDETAFEEFVSSWLVSHAGYNEVKVGTTSSDFDAHSAIDTAEWFTFIGLTQGTQSGDLLARYGNDAGQAQRGFVRRLAQQIDVRGTVAGEYGTASRTSGSRSGWPTSNRLRV